MIGGFQTIQLYSVMKVRRETSYMSFLYLLSYVKYLRLTMMILTRYHIHIFAMAIGVGIITKIGSSVKNLQIGDRVGKKDSS